ncbi:cytosolic sulfotransferase 15-like [Euphorbia lathyris]|uniref:cytosolic sulfotransferase 15-like n=1 Tax=Euphorbia lathyris TaxID=212925 RepID=UPI00331312A0
MEEHLNRDEEIFSGFSLYQGFWCPTMAIDGISSFQKSFQAQDTDIIIASNPKSGTTWLKALIFSITNRTQYTSLNTPLLTTNPHVLLPFLEYHLFVDNLNPDLTDMPSPRFISSHFPFLALPESIKQSNCRIIYICRNPFDSAVSLWHHCGITCKDFKISVEDFCDMYFKGRGWYGPYWDNVLGYWKESLENPNKVLFLKYEDMKEDIAPCLKRIAEFIGHPFSEEEEKNGVVLEIAEMCSLSKLKNLDVNKNGVVVHDYPNKVFFRKGEVGKWVDHISPSKKQQLENVMHEKLSGSGLSFKLSF